MEKKLMLIDGNNLAYRAYYALPDSIATSSGTITNAVLGFTSMLIKLIEDHEPDRIIAAFDSRGPTFRHDMYADYKVHRKEMPEQLTGQIPLIEEVLGAFNIAILKKEGYEADDIIATIVEKARRDYSQIFIISGDKDILQLVSDKVKVVVNKKGITDIMTYGPETVRDNFGVGPERIKDLLALMGDSSDNIPGIPGIGPKTASKLLKQYKGIEDLYQNIEKIENCRQKKLLEENRELAFKSLELTELKTDLELDLGRALKDSYAGIDMAEIEQLFSSLEFRNVHKRLKNLKLPVKESGKGPEPEANQAEKLVDLGQGSSLDRFKGEMGDKAYILYLDGRSQILFYLGDDNVYSLDRELLADKNIRKDLQDVFSGADMVWCGYDFKKIYKLLRRYGCLLEGRVVDFKVLYLLLNQHQADVGIDDLLYRVCGADIGGEVQKRGQLEFSFEKKEESRLDFKRIALYPQIEASLLEEIKKEGLDRVYEQIEEPLIKVLADMEYTGVYVDKGYLQGLIEQYHKDIERLKLKIYEICGQRFNINSTQQLAAVLYEEMGLPATKKIKTGYSTDVSALTAIKGHSPVIEEILDYREKTKLKNTYIDVLPRLISPIDGRIHATYNQMGTTTGRISSNDPNLQNIPIRTSLGRQIRKAFVPGRGYELILAADYSQIELRILAHLSEDEGLMDAFNRGEDIHSRTASEVFGVDYENVDDALRRKAKAINFGIIYGMTKYGLMNRLSIPEDEAERYINAYFGRFPRVRGYIEHLIEEACRLGYASTIFGRKRKIPELGSSNQRLRNLGERLAVNTPIQGSAADIMKLSTVMLYNRMKEKGLDSNIILHVHDELVLELKKKDLEEVRELVRQCMEGCIKLKVSLKVDIKTGKNWYI
ncbi:MAG: DNA polymerase I [Actinomycetota bacterium]